MRSALLVLLCIYGALGLDPRWKLVWSDEFSGTELDTTKWTARTQPGFADNGELEYYIPAQVSVANGNLVITSTNTSYKEGYPYVSGFLDTSKKFSYTFGRYEVFAKLPTGKGMWPAHWLLSEFECWPVGAEIDIMENLGNNMEVVYGTYHYGDCCKCNVGNGSSITYNVDLSQDYHTYAVEWWPDNITWYLDDSAYHVVTSDSLAKGQPWQMDTTPHYFILNTAVGGHWGGNPNASDVFPQYHYVDYVRVYGWEPCESGCGSNGCCDEATQICTCNPGYFGANCEYEMDVPFNIDFTSNDSQVGILSALNSAISGGKLTLEVTNSSCPTGCNGQLYMGGSWGTTHSYDYGNFSATVQAPSASGTSLLLWGITVSSVFEGIQVSIDGRLPTQASIQYWIGGVSNWVGSFQLGFDASQGFHTYQILYMENVFVVFADGKPIAKTNSAPSAPLQYKIELQYSTEWYGPFNGITPVYAYGNAAAWVKPYTPPVNCTATENNHGGKATIL